MVIIRSKFDGKYVSVLSGIPPKIHVGPDFEIAIYPILARHRVEISFSMDINDAIPFDSETANKIVGDFEELEIVPIPPQ